VALIEIRISWDDPIARLSDMDLREELSRRGIEVRTMVCRRDDKTREFVFKGEPTVAPSAEKT
jgi:hypothetical protein